jgi:hypothetical protein
MDVRLDRSALHVELSSDRPVAQPLGDQQRHLALA